MRNYTESTLVELVKELQSTTNPHKLEKSSPLAIAIIDNCGALSHDNLEKFSKMLMLELADNMLSNSKKANF